MKCHFQIPCLTTNFPYSNFSNLGIFHMQNFIWQTHFFQKELENFAANIAISLISRIILIVRTPFVLPLFCQNSLYIWQNSQISFDFPERFFFFRFPYAVRTLYILKGCIVQLPNAQFQNVSPGWVHD